ncbi:hypothetical protein M493_01135 [Geobacillus genomosp. 3]|uniref:Uncharacterized protein n=1 Tax=Geobacillus genomosp. 3 TaxID=1921421 RepID=S5Z8R5_GEOG3|nr:hypothetical protein M493_01135 [Geobacillus genomosp. 3]
MTQLNTFSNIYAILFPSARFHSIGEIEDVHSDRKKKGSLLHIAK